MGPKSLLDLRVKEHESRIFELNEKLEQAKEEAFSAHESYLTSGKSDRSAYDRACIERERLKEELMNEESKLNNIISSIYRAEFKKHEGDFPSFSRHNKNLLNLAFICLGLVFALLIKRLFA